MQVVWQPSERQWDSVPAKPLSLDTSVTAPAQPCRRAKAVMSAVMARSAACLGPHVRSSAAHHSGKHARPTASCADDVEGPTGGC
jgi:hypothetical protein